MPKKKKKKKLTLQQMMWEDRMTAEDLANLSGQRPVRINVFQRAKKIKTWSRFVQLAEQENISPAEALTLMLAHIKRRWLKYKIIQDPDQRGAILMLLSWQKKMGARKLYQHPNLKDFCSWTGYKKLSYSTFQDDLTKLSQALGVGKKNTGAFTENRRKRETASRARSGRKPVDLMKRIQEQIDAGFILTEHGWKKPQK